jgi:hypothetical protein
MSPNTATLEYKFELTQYEYKYKVRYDEHNGQIIIQQYKNGEYVSAEDHSVPPPIVEAIIKTVELFWINKK